MVSLPLDVLLAVIEEIGMQHRPDFDLLWAFCAMCRALRRHAQKYLFHSLSLGFAEEAPYSCTSAAGMLWERMELILEANPHVAVYVKSLRFMAGLLWSLSPRFISLLSKFTHLSTLRFGHYDEDGVWGTLHEPQKRSLESVLAQLPSITSLQIVNVWGIPISVLFPCTNLGALYIDKDSAFDEPELAGMIENISVSHLPLTNVISVRAARSFKSLEPLFAVYPSIGVPLIDKRNVMHLFLPRIGDDECLKLKDFSSLRTFEVDISLLSDARGLFMNFHPSSLRSLDCLGMEFNVDLAIEYPSSVLAAALATSPGLPALSKVVITIAFYSDGYSAIMDDMNEELATLDQLFASASNFPSLRTVSIDIKAERIMDGVTKFRPLDDIKRYLPLVAARQNCTLTQPSVHFWE